MTFLDITNPDTNKSEILIHIKILFNFLKKILDDLPLPNDKDIKCKTLCQLIFDQKIKTNIPNDVTIQAKQINLMTEFDTLLKTIIDPPCFKFEDELNKFLQQQHGQQPPPLPPRITPPNLQRRETTDYEARTPEVDRLNRELNRTDLTPEQRQLYEDRLRELLSSMPGDINEEQKRKLSDKVIETMYKNRDFDEKVKEVKDQLGEFINITCLNNDQSPQPFENQLINIDVFLRSLYEFEELIRSGKKYKPPKKEKIDALKNKEVGELQDLEEIKEPSLKSNSVLKDMNNQSDFKAFKELAHDNKSVYDKLISSNNLINGNVLYQTFAGLPNTVSSNNIFSFNPNSSNTPNIQTLQNNFAPATQMILDEIGDIFCKPPSGFKNSNSLPAYKRLEDPSNMDRLLRHMASSYLVDRRCNAFINLINVQYTNDIYLDNYLFLKLLRDKIGSADPLVIKLFYDEIMKSYSGLIQQFQYITPEADNDFKNKYTLYQHFLKGLFTGTPELGHTPQFTRDGMGLGAGLNI